MLEAGGQPPPESMVPGLAPFMTLDGHESDWQYRTTRQAHSQLNYVNNASAGGCVWGVVCVGCVMVGMRRCVCRVW